MAGAQPIVRELETSIPIPYFFTSSAWPTDLCAIWQRFKTMRHAPAQMLTIPPVPDFAMTKDEGFSLMKGMFMRIELRFLRRKC